MYSMNMESLPRRCSGIRKRLTRTALGLQVLAVIFLFAGVVVLSVTLSGSSRNGNTPVSETSVAAAKSSEGSSKKKSSPKMKGEPTTAPVVIESTSAIPTITPHPSVPSTSGLVNDISVPPAEAPVSHQSFSMMPIDLSDPPAQHMASHPPAFMFPLVTLPPSTPRPSVTSSLVRDMFIPPEQSPVSSVFHPVSIPPFLPTGVPPSPNFLVPANTVVHSHFIPGIGLVQHAHPVYTGQPLVSFLPL